VRQNRTSGYALGSSLVCEKGQLYNITKNKKLKNVTYFIILISIYYFEVE